MIATIELVVIVKIEAGKTLTKIELALGRSEILWDSVPPDRGTHKYHGNGKGSLLRFLRLLADYKLNHRVECEGFKRIWKRLKGTGANHNFKTFGGEVGAEVLLRELFDDTDKFRLDENVLPQEQLSILVYHEKTGKLVADQEQVLRAIIESIDPKTGQVKKTPLISSEESATASKSETSAVTETESFGHPSSQDRLVADSELDWVISTNNTLVLPFSADRATADLDRVYTALLVDPTCMAERIARCRLLREFPWEDSGLEPDDVRQAAAQHSTINRILENFDLVPDALGIDNTGESLNIGEAFCDHQCLIVLGDPGSGKTTVARWMALNMARGWKSGGTDVQVFLSSIDPEAEDSEDPPKTFSLGPPKFPFLVRAAEFADYLKNSSQISPSLFLFLGCHRSLVDRSLMDRSQPVYLKPHPQAGRPVSELLRSRLAQTLVNEGQALVILDGLDEVADLKTRETLRNAVEDFLTSHVLNTDREEFQASGSGNRMLISSRVKGYNICPLRHGFMQVIVQPMGQIARTRFFRHWLSAVAEASSGSNDESAETRADELTRQIHQRGPKVEAIASNPLQGGALAAVYRESRNVLPETRVEIYQHAVDQFFKHWADRLREQSQLALFSDTELTFLLEQVATWIHESANNAAGLITEKQLTDLLVQARARWLNTKSSEIPEVDRLTIAELLRIFSNDVGLLAERAEKIYGFLVLPIQEYFVAGSLIRGDCRQIAARLRSHLDDTRFREPILMAIAQLALKSSDLLEETLKELLRGQNPSDELLPQAALIAVDGLAEANQLTDHTAKHLIKPLLEALAKVEGRGYLDVLQGIIRHAMMQLANIRSKFVSVAITELIHDQPRLAPIVADLLLEIDTPILTKDLIFALSDADRFDSPDREFPIFRLIQQQGLDRLHEARPLPMRQFLESTPEALEWIGDDPEWLALMIMLYGGVADNGTNRAARSYYEYGNFLQLDFCSRQPFLPQYSREFGLDDPSNKIAIHLDTDGSQWKKLDRKLQEFSPKLVDRDSFLTGGLIQAIQKCQPASELAEQLREFAACSTDKDAIVDTCLACSLSVMQKN